MAHSSEYLNMNGYGIYIWPSYIIALFLISLLVIFVILRKKKIEKKIRIFIKNTENEN